MPEITEIFWMPLKPGAEDSPAVAELKKSGEALIAQPDLKHSYHGHPIEIEHSVEIVNVWASEQAYKDAMASVGAHEAWKQMQEVIDTSDQTRQPHRVAVVFKTPFSAVADAPVVTMSALFLPTDVNVAALEKAFAAAAGGGGQPDGFVAGVNGWVTEDVVDHPKMQGKKAKVFIAASGWESLEKNKLAQEASADRFKEELGKFTDVWDLHHTIFEKHK